MSPSVTKKIVSIHPAPAGHWVGDGFPVRSAFTYDDDELLPRLSPFLLLDYAGPAEFAPADRPRGVGPHPHRGFETVTIIYDGEVEHRDSAGNGGRIGPGDTQWMTAASGILHEEMHSPEFTRRGGKLEMVQLWVNLRAADKTKPPGYQTILAADVPVVPIGERGGTARVIAGDFAGHLGPARTFTPMDVWDVRLPARAKAALPFRGGANAALFVLSGTVAFADGQKAGPAQLVLLDNEAGELAVESRADSKLLLLSGTPIDEPVAAYGPFVMNTEAEIHQAIADFQAGRMGRWRD